MKKIICKSRHKQKGMASLLISLVVLVTITFVTFYTSRAVVMEQKISTNDYRGRMAFEAAEAGIEATMAALSQGWIVQADLNNDDMFDLVVSDIVFDDDKDGTAANNKNTATLSNGSSVRVVLDGSITTRNVIQLQVTSTGISDDNSARRQITQIIVAIPPLPNVPDSPLLTRGAVVIGGSATVSNLEGHSTIWSGGNVDLGSNNSTSTQIANPQGANYPDCLGGSVQCEPVASSSREIVGVDIIESDSSLANLTDAQFFENFFGTTPEIYRDSRTDIVTSDLVAQRNQVGKVIWVDTSPPGAGIVSLSGTNTFGSLAEPVIVIVDGNLSVSGNNNFNGLLYVRGSVQGTGSVDVTGAMIVNGINSSSGGSLDVVYNSKVLEATAQKAKPAGGSGSWRDF